MSNPRGPSATQIQRFYFQNSLPIAPTPPPTSSASSTTQQPHPPPLVYSTPPFPCNLRSNPSPPPPFSFFLSLGKYFLCLIGNPSGCFFYYCCYILKIINAGKQGVGKPMLYRRRSLIQNTQFQNMRITRLSSFFATCMGPLSFLFMSVTPAENPHLQILKERKKMFRKLVFPLIHSQLSSLKIKFKKCAIIQ